MAQFGQSSFNGDDLFGSGPHRIEWGELTVSNSEFSFPGFHGTGSRQQGVKKRTGRITGHLRADTAGGLVSLIAAITAYVADGGAYNLTDNQGETTASVRLDNFIPRGPRERSERGAGTVEWLQDYEVTMTCLMPV